MGHMRKWHGSCWMRKTGNFSQLRRREDPHQHRWNTAAVSVSKYYFPAVFHSSEIHERPACSATQVRIGILRIDSRSCGAHTRPIFHDFRVQVCEPTAAYRYRQNMSTWCQVNCIRIPSNCPSDVCHCL